MEHKHLDATALENLLAEDRTVAQNEQLFHLLAVCPACRKVGGWLLELHQENALPPLFGLIDAALGRSRADAFRLWEALAPLDPEDRLARLHAEPRFASWGLCELLIRESRQSTPEKAAEAVHLADLAVHVADLIPGGEPFEEKWVYQLRSLAWAAFANARKAQGDLSAAERSFEMSDSWWAAGAEDIGDALRSGASLKLSSCSIEPRTSSSMANPSTGIPISPAGASSRKPPCSSNRVTPNPPSWL
jgi:hypothetical protein